MKEHLSGYQRRDWEVVDYHMYQLGDTELSFRGTESAFQEIESAEALSQEDYFVCIGAAQTFGCFCPRPFPSILQNQLGLKVLNLGYGGAGPFFFLNHQELLPYINQAKFVIVQVMSGRSESNSLFDSGGLEYLTRRNDSQKISANKAYSDLFRQYQPPLFQQPLLNKIARSLIGSPKVKEIVAETRANWIANYHKLLAQITIPKILFWYSRRSPWYWQRYSHAQALFGDFPHMVNAKMLAAIQPYANDYVQCVTRRGSPQPLYSRFTGEPVVIDCSLDRPDLDHRYTHNRYYPSPQMHEDAAHALESRCREILTS